jgi:hypothetical protein
METTATTQSDSQIQSFGLLSESKGDELTPMGIPPKQPNRKEVVSLVDEENLTLLELIYNPSLFPPIQFAVGMGGKTSLATSYPMGKQTLVPISDPLHQMESAIILLPRGFKPYGTQAELVAEIKGFIHRYADVPPFWEDLMAHYILMTWVYDRFSALPYLRFMGEPGTGKTRAFQCIGQLAYKAIITGGATSISPFFRMIEKFGGTFLIDEGDWKDDAEHSEMTKILNGGYMYGLPVMRSTKVGDDYEPRAYRVFGPKVITNRKPFGDPALETRCLTLETTERKIRSDIPRQLPNSFYKEAEEIRCKLLQWRLDNFFLIQADESKLLHLEPRLTQIGTTLYSVSTDPDFKKSLVDHLSKKSRNNRLEGPQRMVIEAMAKLVQTEKVFYVGDVTKEINESRSLEEDEAFKAKKVGGLIKSLGFETHKTRNGFQVDVDPELLQEKTESYSVNIVNLVNIAEDQSSEGENVLS